MEIFFNMPCFTIHRHFQLPHCRENTVAYPATDDETEERKMFVNCGYFWVCLFNGCKGNYHHVMEN